MDKITEHLKQAIDAKRDLAIALQRDLTAIPALGPQNDGTGEKEKAHKLVEWLARLGLPEPVGLPAPDPSVPGGKRPNLVVTIPGRAKDRTLWIMSHLDIVPPGEAKLWTSDPYTLVVDGDRLVGRGVEDNQQGLVASVLAAAAVRELGLEPACTVRLLFVSDEETGSAQGVQHVLAAAPHLFTPADSALVPDHGAPDGSEIEIAEKSILWLKFATKGRQCHASTPQKGVNAFAAASLLVVRLGELARIYPAADPLFDPAVSTFTPTKKEANVPNVNTLPGEDVFYLDSRILPSVDLDGVMARIRSIADGVEKECGVTISIETVQRASSPATPADAHIVKALLRAVSEVYGVKARTMGIGGGTVGAFLRHRGIATVVWSRLEGKAHQPDESCLLANLLGDSLVMASLMLDPVSGP
ncbi:MAG: M20 family metallo-hydrolase [Spirochaetes bacterium]|nr:M20 family metallo-hydrolase [Spirochaetota bacterium]